MRIVFMGSPAFSVPTLERIVGDGHHVVAAYTRAPKPGGRRGLDVVRTPVHDIAASLGIPVSTPASLKSAEETDRVRALDADLALVIAYGLLLPKAVLEGPKFGCLNLHASLLPRWRGAAPIQRAIMAGDPETAVDLMRMEEGLDTGPVGLRRIAPIGPQDTAGDIAHRLSELAADVAAEGLRALEQGTLTFREQQGEASYARKIAKHEAEIDWSGSASEVRNHIRGLSPSPGAFSILSVGGRKERIKIYRADSVPGQGAPGAVLSADMTVACGEGAIRIIEGQRVGKTVVRGRELMGGESLVDAAFMPSEGSSVLTEGRP
jgi:methionyl-tRNA formyltransferase